MARYSERQLAYRAEAIARTETQRAAHEAQDEAYQQAVDAGHLDADRLQCIWHAGAKPRTRDSHAAMRGQRRRMSVAFTSGAGVALRYPCDPDAPASEVVHCRCSKSVRVLPVGQSAVNGDAAPAAAAA